jgi:LPXTG-motif cell wall-anchored protein
MKRILFAAAVAVGVFAVCTPAHATDTHWTDGTQCAGQLCPGAPPPTAPVFAQGHDCQLDVIDPPSFVYVTEHFTYGNTPPAVGVVPVVDDASAVFPYVGNAPGLFTVDIEQYVAGKQGWRADTWNIGKGVTAWVPFDCTTTTTSEPQCLIPEGCTTTTTLADANASTSTTFDIGTAITATSVPPSSPVELPRTGSSLWPLTLVGAFAIGAGLMLVRAARRSR